LGYPSFTFRKQMKTIFLLLIITCICAVFYFSWLPNPDLRTETYVPKWLLDWSNTYYNLRTAVPFIALGFFLEVRANNNNNNNNNKCIKKINSSLRLFIQNTAISAVIVCVAEGGQFFIHNRNPDLMDVFFGILGSLLGSLGYFIFHYFLNIKMIADAK
jgi:hypothetical protein